MRRVIVQVINEITDCENRVVLFCCAIQFRQNRVIIDVLIGFVEKYAIIVGRNYTIKFIVTKVGFFRNTVIKSTFYLNEM